MEKYKAYHIRIGWRNNQNTRKKFRSEWGDEECKEAISKKNISRKKYLQKEPEQAKNNIHKQEKKLTRPEKKKKQQWLNNRLKQIEESHKQNERRTFFKDIQIFQNYSFPPIFTFKEENDTLKSDKQEVLDRWKQYFDDLMKTDKKIADQTQEESFNENEIEIEEPTYKEVSDIIIILQE